MKKRFRNRSPLILELGLMEGGKDFEISELTVNPYLTRQKSGITKTEIWIEILCERKSEETPEIFLPSFHVNFKDIENHSIRPTTTYPQKDAKSNIDLNKVLYSELWTSMIFSRNDRPDFMQKGIEGGKRLIGKDVDFNNLIEELAITQESTNDKDLKELLSELIRKFGLLNDCFQRFNLTSNDEVIVPEGLLHPGSQLKLVPTMKTGTLAYSRKKWLDKADANIFDTVYPCEVSSLPLHNGWKLVPKPIASIDHPINTLKKGDAVSFWFYFDSVSGVQEDVAKDLRKFNFEIYPKSALGQMNIFLRVPKDHSIESGAVPSFSALTRSLDLYKAWDKHVDNRAYSTIFKDEIPNQLMQVNVDLVDGALAQGKLRRIFIFGFIISACVAYQVNLLTSVMIEEGTTYSSEITIGSLNPLIWHYALYAALASFIFVIAILLDYNFLARRFKFFRSRKTFRNGLLIIGSFLALVPILLPIVIFVLEFLTTRLSYVFS